MSQFGNYQVSRKIGFGGFGVVYEGFDPRIGRRVAIKTCSSDRPDVRARFLQEARIAGNLDHPNITVIYDYGEEDEVPYLVQELLSGEDLDKKIARRERLSVTAKLEWLIQIARALDYAHRRGVIHRDIKPSNIRVLDDDQVKILDFGIAKHAHDDPGLTRAGETIGTPCYLAPEQIRDAGIDHRCDIYAFGIMAYELLSYRRAFPGDRPARVLYAVINEDPPPLEDVALDLPPDLAPLVRRCHAKAPAERFESGVEVALELTRITRQIRHAPASEAATHLIGVPELRDAQDPRDATLVPQATPSSQRRPTAPAPRSPANRSRSAPEPARRDAVAVAASARPRWPLVVVAAVVLAGALALAWLEREGRLRVPGLTGAGAMTVQQDVEQDQQSASNTSMVAAGSSGSQSSSPVPGGILGDGSAGPLAASPGSGTRAAGARLLPLPARLRIEAAWHPAMTVRIDGLPARTLDRTRELQLTPGSHRLVFELSSDGYQARATRVLELSEGQSTTVESPIARPGALTVRASLGTPQLRVALDSRQLGTTPLSTQRLAPGSYILRLAPASAAEPAKSLAIELATGEELVITTSLAEGDESIVRRPFRG